MTTAGAASGPIATTVPRRGAEICSDRHFCYAGGCGHRMGYVRDRAAFQ